MKKISLKEKFKKGLKTVKTRWDEYPKREKERHLKKLEKLRLEEERLDLKIKVQKAESRVKSKRKQTSIIGKIEKLIEGKPTKKKKRSSKKSKKKKRKPRKKEKKDEFTLPKL